MRALPHCSLHLFPRVGLHRGNSALLFPSSGPYRITPSRLLQLGTAGLLRSCFPIRARRSESFLSGPWEEEVAASSSTRCRCKTVVTASVRRLLGNPWRPGSRDGEAGTSISSSELSAPLVGMTIRTVPLASVSRELTVVTLTLRWLRADWEVLAAGCSSVGAISCAGAGLTSPSGARGFFLLPHHPLLKSAQRASFKVSCTGTL